MTIHHHPATGAILICDFSGFHEPEMTKRRPVVVVSKSIVSRPNICTVVPFSTTEPSVILPMHYKLVLDPPLPPPYDSAFHWIKGDMIYALAFDRFCLPFIKKDRNGKRIYDERVLTAEQLGKVQKCIMAGIGIMKVPE